MTDSIDFKYRAFISYSHADAPLAKWLRLHLEGFSLRGLAGRETALGPVPKSLRPIFRDREDFGAGVTLNGQTIAALDASAALIVLCSPASARSRYVNEIIRLFKHRHPERRILPLIVSGEPNDAARDCFPPALKFELDAEGQITDSTSATTIAADVRENGKDDDREVMLAKIVASLIGLSQEEVFEGAERERKRQALVRDAIAVGVIILAGVGGYFAHHSQKQSFVITDTAAKCARRSPTADAEAGPQNALEQCIKALEAYQKGAETDPRDAETVRLINQDKPEEAERLQREAAHDDETAEPARTKKAAERYRAIAATAGLNDPKKARAYYAKAAQLDPENINGMFRHASMEQQAGNLAEAERAYNVVLGAGVIGKDDFELYWAKHGLDDIHVARDDSPGAPGAEASTDAEPVTKADPNNAGSQHDLAVSYEKTADALVNKGALDDALKAYRDGLAIADPLAKANPDNAGWQHDFSISNEKVGDALVARGALTDALKAYRNGLAIAERLAKANPANLAWQHDLSVSYGKVGDVLLDQGALADALKAYRDGLAIAERLAEGDPANPQWQRDLSVSHEKVGNVHVDQGELADALKAYRDGLAVEERLAKTDPANSEWRRDLSVIYNKVGDVALAQGELAGALKAYRDGLAIAERLAEGDPANAQWQVDLLVSYNKVGDGLLAQGAPADALTTYRDGLAVAERLAKTDPANSQWQRDLSVFYNKVGDVLVDQGATDDALKAYRDGLAIRERLANADPANAGWKADLAASLGKLGQLHVRMDDNAEARRMFERGKTIVAPFAAKSGHQLWIGYLKAFDESLAALDKNAR